METLVLLLIGFGVFAIMAAFVAQQCRHVVQHQEVLIIQRTDKASQVIRHPGTYWFQPFFSQNVSKRSWSGRYPEHEIEIKGTPQSWTFETYLWPFTQESLESKLRIRLHLHMKSENASPECIYDLYEHVALLCETTTRDVVSTISLGELRAKRRKLQATLKQEMSADLLKLDIVLEKVSIAPAMTFEPEVEAALKKETTTMLEKRASLAIEDHKNEILVRAAQTEATNRTNLANADAKNINQVAKALENNTSEAARYIILMRFLHELSRLDPNSVKENIHRPYLEILREFIKDIETVPLEEASVLLEPDRSKVAKVN
tara:strand:+ start:327 stop:1280 length:954 start_codon:yes stop_codon:yes gene_type:complete